MYKIALIGNRDTIIGFKLLGISLFPTTKKDEAVEILDKLVKEEYAVIFVTLVIFAVSIILPLF